MNYANLYKINFQHFFSSCNFFYNFFFAYIKIAKNSLAKYYQNNKEGLQKKARERYQSLS